MTSIACEGLSTPYLVKRLFVWFMLCSASTAMLVGSFRRVLDPAILRIGTAFPMAVGA